jgi:hypothetical protein
VELLAQEVGVDADAVVVLEVNPTGHIIPAGALKPKEAMGVKVRVRHFTSECLI